MLDPEMYGDVIIRVLKNRLMRDPMRKFLKTSKTADHWRLPRKKNVDVVKLARIINNKTKELEPIRHNLTLTLIDAAKPTTKITLSQVAW